MPSHNLCLSCARNLRNLRTSTPLSTSILPKQSHRRAASILSSLSDLPSAYSRRIRVGRGPSSGHGKTSGRGHKGQRQHGKVPAGFEGGQTPIEVAHGKRGYKNPFSINLTTLPLSRIQSFISQNRISADVPITVRELVRSNCVSMPKDGIKLLATSFSHQASLDAQPPLDYPLHIVVSRASASAIRAVEAAGGSVTTRYYTNWAIRRIVEGRMDPMVSLGSEEERDNMGGKRRGVAAAAAVAEKKEGQQQGRTPRDEAGDSEGKSAREQILNAAAEGESSRSRSSSSSADLPQAAIPQETPIPAQQRTTTRPQYPYRLPDAISRKAIEYYRDEAHRGYLAHTVKEGEGPSLYFRPPNEVAARAAAAAAGKKKQLEENRMW